MLETLYKTNNPEGVPAREAEYYELILDAESVNGKVMYFVREMHGWWSEEQKRPVHNLRTLSPDEGYATWDEAYEQVQRAALSPSEERLRPFVFSPLLWRKKIRVQTDQSLRLLKYLRVQAEAGAGVGGRAKRGVHSCPFSEVEKEISSVNIKRAICHEAGHAVATLHFGFRVERVEVFRGMPRTPVDLKCGTRDSMIVLASGIAAEQFIFNNYDSGACGSDQKTISEYGGGAIQDLLPEAIAVIRSHEACLKQMRAQLMKRWVERQSECEAASNFDADSDLLKFELLSHQEINDLCSEFGQGARAK